MRLNKCRPTMICRRLRRYPDAKGTRYLFYAVLIGGIIFLRYWLGREEFVPVVIVEEHHEALLYWVETANRGDLLKKGNTLVHIDAHSDDALPEYYPEMPLFTWPETEDQIGMLLQKNDIFIMAAVMIGLIDRFIWIVPEWDDEFKDIGHSAEEVELGWVNLKAPKDAGVDTVPYLCQCRLEDDVRTCSYYNNTIEPSPSRGIDPMQRLHSALCTNTRAFTFETLSVRTAMQILDEEREWFVDQESLILDIDEDYFSVVLPGTSLIDAGLHWKTVEILNQKLEKLFCPKSIHDEDLSSELLDELFDLYVKVCTSQDPKAEMCLVSVNILIERLWHGVMLEWWREATHLYCAQNDYELKLALTDFIQVIRSVTLKQLNVILHQVGFCLNTSPKTLGFEEIAAIQICIGSNDPDDSFVTLHRASELEFNLEIKHLQKFIFSLKPRPKLVTIARSARDGYTPKDMVAKIERELGMVFQSSEYRNKEGVGSLPYKLVYDEDILEVRHVL